MKSVAVIFLSCFLMAHADVLSAEPPDRLVYLGSYSVYDKSSGLREPSGLSFDNNTGELWTVSDDSRHVFRIDQNGTVTARLPKVHGLADAEGIATNKAGDLVILSEDKGALFTLSSTSEARVKVNKLLDMKGGSLLLDALDGQPDRLSPEGIAIDLATGIVFVANERDPRLLIKLSPLLDEILSVTTLVAKIGFASKFEDDVSLDTSGLAVDSTRNGLWFSSDTGKVVFFWDGSNKPAQRFELLWLKDGELRTVKNAEGIALGVTNNELFVITDNGMNSSLHTYRIE